MPTKNRRPQRPKTSRGEQIASHTPLPDDPDRITLSRKLLAKVIQSRVEEVRAKLQFRADLADALQDVLRDTVAKLDRSESDVLALRRQIEDLGREPVA